MNERYARFQHRRSRVTVFNFLGKCPGNDHGLEQHKNDGNAEHTEKLEVYPDTRRKTVGHHQVQDRAKNKKRDPVDIEAPPERLRQSSWQLTTHQAFEQGLFPPMGEQQDSGKKQIEDAGFDLDEGVIMKIESQATENQDQQGGDPGHCLNATTPPPLPGHEHNGGNNQHFCSRINTMNLIRYKKEDDG